MKFGRIIINNIGLKVLSLILACITWFYVFELTKGDSEKTVLQKLILSTSYVYKKILIRPVFTGSIQNGYRLVEADIKVSPDAILAFAPARILSKKEFVNTQPIDLSEHTKSKTIEVELESILPTIKPEKIEVQVYLPIEKIAEAEK